MDPLQRNPALLVESRGEESPAPPARGEASAEDKVKLGPALRGKCQELAALVLLADDPREAAAYVLACLPHHVTTLFELVSGRHQVASNRRAILTGQIAQPDRWHGFPE